MRDSLGATHPMPQTPEGPETSIRDALRASHQFAAYFALVTLTGAIGSVVLGRAPWYVLLIAPPLCYAIYFLLPLVLQLTGVATSDLNINLWFAWAICGGLVFFMVGLLIKGHELFATMGEILRVGLLCASAWIACVIVVWFVRRASLKRGA